MFLQGNSHKYMQNLSSKNQGRALALDLQMPLRMACLLCQCLDLTPGSTSFLASCLCALWEAMVVVQPVGSLPPGRRSLIDWPDSAPAILGLQGVNQGALCVPFIHFKSKSIRYPGSWSLARSCEDTCCCYLAILLWPCECHNQGEVRGIPRT